MSKEVDAIKRTKFWVRIAWPGYLMFKFITYALIDKPPHFLFWASGRVLHASFYLLAAVMIAVTLGPTPRRILELKALAIWAIAFTSIIGDIVVHQEATVQRWNSSISWFGLIIANQMVVRLRISVLDERGRG